MAEHGMREGELFFSVTDGRGVIRQGNSVFGRVSGYRLEEMVGAPHNVVRHPAMPGGLFRLVWERLLAGRAVGAYMRNATRDGGEYWVFATISPLPGGPLPGGPLPGGPLPSPSLPEGPLPGEHAQDGFLSVRMAPRARLREVSERVYAVALAAEEELRRAGGHRREAAELGAKVIKEELRGYGFASYEAFMVDAASAETSAREAVAPHARPGARGAIGEILAGAEELHGVLGALVARLDGYQRVCEELASSSEKVLDIAQRLARSVAAAQDASARTADSAPVLANVARVMAAPIGEAVGALERLGPELARLRGDVARLRFWIALARVYAEMSAAFAAEVHDGAAPEASLGSVPLLCEASAAGAWEMAGQVRRVNAGLHGAAGLLGEASELLEEFRKWLGQWRNLVLRHRASPAIGAHLALIDGEITASWDWMKLLRHDGYEAAAVPFDPALMTAPLARISRSL